MFGLTEEQQQLRREVRAFAERETFFVPKGTPGFRPGKKENKLGLRASEQALHHRRRHLRDPAHGHRP